MANPYEPAHVFQPCPVLGLLRDRPVQSRRLEGRERVRIRNVRPRRFAGELGKLPELAPAALAHGVRHLVVEIGEKAERLRRAPFLAHEQERNVGREQEHRLHGLDRAVLRKVRDAFAERAVADLIVVLDERDECGRRQMTARLAAHFGVPVVRDIALVHVA